jgi:hypothetical protein
MALSGKEGKIVPYLAHYAVAFCEGGGVVLAEIRPLALVSG